MRCCAARRRSRRRVHPAPSDEPVSAAELAALQDAEGALTEPAAAALRRAVFRRGVAPDARAEAWPLLLGVFPPGSTRAERQRSLEEKRQQYAAHREAGERLAEDPEFKDGSVIVHDVHRTQASHPRHEHHKPAMTEVLRAYAALDGEVGYGQGMSDMLAVLLYALEDAALSFWCFVALLRGSGCSSGLRGDDARRLHLAKDVTDTASAVLARLARLLELVTPELHGHVVACECAELLFCYPWVKMLLKRELPFEEVPRLWEACWCAPAALADQDQSEDFVLCCCAAILQRRQKELLKGKSLEAFFTALRNVQVSAAELVRDGELVCQAASAAAHSSPG